MKRATGILSIAFSKTSIYRKSHLFDFSGIVQDTAFNENSRLEGISKYNAVTMDNLTSTILKDDDQEAFQLVRYLGGILVLEEGNFN